ncbi:hypothetical protein [Seleniivibrio woodruffii]|uniref:hypothetical protein n=1 Tax=Seleniivibrio woodruffii TaxID=1078050 RepID=UPI002409205B|nr:hypothetical protein [Seleniivibrio woodruffii]
METCAGEYTGAGFAAEAAHSGMVGLTAPFIFYGGDLLMTSNSAGGSTAILSSLGQDSASVLTADFALPVGGECVLKNTLSAMDSDTAGLTIANSLSENGFFILPAVTGAGIRGGCDILSTIGDYGLKGLTRINNPLCKTSQSGKVSIVRPPVTSSAADDSVTFICDGKDRTKDLISLEISLNGIPTLKAEAKIPCPRRVSIDLNGDFYSFDIIACSEGRGKTVMSGIMPEPEGSFTADIDAMKASEAVMLLSGKIVWAAEDFTACIKGTFTHWSLASYLADSAGLSARLLPNGYIAVTGGGTTHGIRPEGVFARTFKKHEQKYKAVTVNYRGDTLNHVHIEAPAEAGLNTDVKIRLYHGGSSRLLSDSAGLAKTAGGITETVTENVLFQNGKGVLSLPAVKVLTEGMTADGKKVSAEGLNGWREAAYTAVYDLYTLSETAEVKRYVRAVTDSSVTVFFKGGRETLTIDAPAVLDCVTALRLAHTLAATPETITLETTRTDGLNTPAGLFCKSSFGRGRVASAKIKVNADPLAVKNIIEVHP